MLILAQFMEDMSTVSPCLTVYSILFRQVFNFKKFTDNLHIKLANSNICGILQEFVHFLHPIGKTSAYVLTDENNLKITHFCRNIVSDIQKPMHALFPDCLFAQAPTLNSTWFRDIGILSLNDPSF